MRYDAMRTTFEEVTLLGIPALFTDLRIERKTVPSGYHLYEIRHDDECRGEAVQVGKNILVNHWGSVITRDKLELGPDGYLDIEADDLNYATGDCRTMREFMRHSRGANLLGDATDDIKPGFLAQKEQDWSMPGMDTEELLRFIWEYDRYIQNANDMDLYRDGWRPVCVNEFFGNEYQEILEGATTHEANERIDEICTNPIQGEDANEH